MAALSCKLFCVRVILKNAVINSVVCGFWVQWVSYEGETLFFFFVSLLVLNLSRS